MPLTVRDGALVGFGMLFAGGATVFYKRKQTLPFKVANAAHACISQLKKGIGKQHFDQFS